MLTPFLLNLQAIKNGIKATPAPEPKKSIAKKSPKRKVDQKE